MLATATSRSINERDMRRNEKKSAGRVTNSDTDEKLVTDLVRAFVWHPDDVRATQRGSGGGVTIIELNVNPADYGAVVGKGGRKISALQAIVQCFGLKDQRKVRLILPESERQGNGFMPDPYRPDTAWKPDKAIALLERVLKRILTSAFEISVVATGEQTNLEVAVDKNDEAWMAAMEPYLHTVFHAIGKSDGHQLYVKKAIPVPTPA